MSDIATAAQKECMSRGILSGYYSLAFTVGIPRLRKARLGIISQVVEYVSATQAEYDAPRQSITIKGHEVCTIVKISNVGDFIAHSRTFGRTGGVRMCELARGAVDEKARLMSGIELPNILALPRILLLDADERYEPPADWRACLVDHPSLRDFHSVIVVPGIKPVFAISVGESTWPLD